MHDIGSLWNAWGLWFQGAQLTNYTLWGAPIFGWGRLGKGMEFVAGAAVIVEIVGPDRLTRFAAWLEGIKLDTVSRAMVAAGGSSISTVQVIGHKYFGAFALVFALIVGALITFVGGLLLVALARGAAHVLEWRLLGTFVKVASVVILAIGFQFDLLSS